MENIAWQSTDDTTEIYPIHNTVHSLINDSQIFLTQFENNFDITKIAIEYAHAFTPATVDKNDVPNMPNTKLIEKRFNAKEII